MIYTNIDEVLNDDLLWHKMALRRTKCKVQADELVHRFYVEYIRLKEIEPNKEINQGYVYTTLKNIWIKDIEYQSKYSLSLYEDSISERFVIDSYDIDEDEYQQNKIDFLLKELDKIEYFHRIIFKYVIMDGISMRQLAKDTGIHYNIIQKSVAMTKEYLKNKSTNEKD